MKFLSARQTEDTKITPIQSEDGFNPFAIGQVDERRIGELYPRLLVARKNRGNAGEIRLVEGSEFKEPGAEGR